VAAAIQGWRQADRRVAAPEPEQDQAKCAVQEAIIGLGAAFRAFFEKRGRYPRFKRKNDQPSFCAANEVGTFRVDGQRILPVIGWIGMREKPPSMTARLRRRFAAMPLTFRSLR